MSSSAACSDLGNTDDSSLHCKLIIYYFTNINVELFSLYRGNKMTSLCNELLNHIYCKSFLFVSCYKLITQGKSVTVVNNTHNVSPMTIVDTVRG